MVVLSTVTEPKPELFRSPVSVASLMVTLTAAVPPFSSGLLSYTAAPPEIVPPVMLTVMGFSVVC